MSRSQPSTSLHDSSNGDDFAKVLWGAHKKSKFSNKLAMHGFWVDSSLEAVQRKERVKQYREDRKLVQHNQVNKVFEAHSKAIRSIQNALAKRQNKMAHLALDNYSAYKIQITWKSMLARKVLYRLRTMRFMKHWIIFRMYMKTRYRASAKLIRYIKRFISHKKRKLFLCYRKAALKISRRYRVYKQVKTFLERLNRWKVSEAVTRYVLLFGVSRAAIKIQRSSEGAKIKKCFQIMLSCYTRRKRLEMLKSSRGKVAFHYLTYKRVEEMFTTHNCVIKLVQKIVAESKKIKTEVVIPLQNSETLKVDAVPSRPKQGRPTNLRPDTHKLKATNSSVATEPPTDIPILSSNQSPTQTQLQSSPITPRPQRKSSFGQGESSPITPRPQRKSSFGQGVAPKAQVKILDATIPKEFVDMYAPRTIYDVIMLVVDLMRVAIENPKLVDGKVPSELMRFHRKSIAKPSKNLIVSQKDPEMTRTLPRKTEISIALPMTTPKVQRSTEFNADTAQRTQLITTQQLPPIKREGHFRKSNTDEIKQKQLKAELKLRLKNNDNAGLVARSKPRNHVLVTDRSKINSCNSAHDDDNDDNDDGFSDDDK